MTNTHQLCDLETNVEEEIKWLFEHEDMGIIEDADDQTISEIADSATPLYNWDLLAYAQDSLWLATVEPEILAFDGEPTAINAIAGNIREHLIQHAHEIHDQLLEEQEDENDTGGPG